jgi:putative inorganic carbon (HCO3(-)) transporter
LHRLRGLAHLITQPSVPHLLLLAGLLVVLAALAFLVLRMSTPAVLSLGIASEVFSGYWKYMGIPLPVDRVLLLLGLGLLAWRGTAALGGRRLIFSPIHLLLATIVVYVTVSAMWAHTLTTSTGFYALLDRLGVIPFVMFTLAPLVFATPRARNALLVALVVLGAYLGFTAAAEGLHVHALVFPRYILNPNLGIHYGRARGPFLEAVADGLSMFMCATAAAVALNYWRSRFPRLACYVVIVSCLAGGIFTLTRTVWVGDVAAPVVVMLWNPRWRRYLPRVLAAGAVTVVALLVLVPGLHHSATARADQTSPIWDRYNTNDAALRGFTSHPVFGIGWEQFENIGSKWLRQAGNYPLTGAGLEVHNVFLSHLVELGIVGASMWILAFFSGVVAAALRRGRDDLYPWRLGLIAIVVYYLIAANLGPMSYPLPNLLLWLWAGIVAADRYSEVRPAPVVPDRFDLIPPARTARRAGRIPVSTR